MILSKLSEYQSFELSAFGTGIDYWMSREKPDENSGVFLKKEARLEISGIFNESSSNTVGMRVQLKARQIAASDGTGLPGFVAIVEFGTPKSKIVKK